MIREAFQGDKGLQGIVKKLPIERQFRMDNVKMVSICLVDHLAQSSPCLVLVQKLEQNTADVSQCSGHVLAMQTSLHIWYFSKHLGSTSAVQKQV